MIGFEGKSRTDNIILSIRANGVDYFSTNDGKDITTDDENKIIAGEATEKNSRMKEEN